MDRIKYPGRIYERREIPSPNGVMHFPARIASAPGEIASGNYFTEAHIGDHAVRLMNEAHAAGWEAAMAAVKALLS